MGNTPVSPRGELNAAMQQPYALMEMIAQNFYWTYLGLTNLGRNFTLCISLI